MNINNKLKNKETPLFQPLKPPEYVVECVKTIEKWASSQTKRDDWAIGDLACRKGFERLLEMYKDKK
jgi:hypothetical protein